ncbi:hypothetical protein DFS33DRAFT_652577 [Desarmillaria ectypa]|nr:hypothetical protein DFS33DRAFT_652577 [Desarmillaria ectypa]
MTYGYSWCVTACYSRSALVFLLDLAFGLLVRKRAANDAMLGLSLSTYDPSGKTACKVSDIWFVRTCCPRCTGYLQRQQNSCAETHRGRAKHQHSNHT